MSEPTTPPARRLVLDLDLVPEQTEDESGAAWGETAPSDGASVQRYLDERPPHHL